MSHIIPENTYKNKNMFKILELLALEGETAQAEMPEIIGCSYRTVLRELKKLENALLIRHSGYRRKKKKGPEQMVWTLTFNGILCLIRWNPEKAEFMVEKNSQLSILFQEWSYIKNDDEVKNYFIDELRLYSLSLFSDIKIRDKTISQTSKMTGVFRKDGISERIVNHREKGCAYHVLAIEPILDGAYFWFDDQERPEVCRIFEYYLRNDVLKEIILTIFMEHQQRFNAMRKTVEILNLTI